MINIETIPIDDSKLNPSGEVTRDGDGNPIIIGIIVRGITFQMTLTWTGGYLTSWTAWNKI